MNNLWVEEYRPMAENAKISKSAWNQNGCAYFYVSIFQLHARVVFNPLIKFFYFQRVILLIVLELSVSISAVKSVWKRN